MVEKPPFERAIDIAGSEQKLADMIGFSQPAVNKAKRRGHCSARLAKAIDEKMAPQVTKEQLRPDLWTPPTAANANTQRRPAEVA